MPVRFLAAAVGATLAGWPLLALPRAAAEGTAEVAWRTVAPAPEPLTLDGNPVVGSSSQATPVRLGLGVWLDPVSEGTTAFYAVRKTATGSRLQVTALGTSESSMTLRLRLSSPGGQDCGSAQDYSGDALPATVTVTAGPDVDACDAAGGYLLSLERSGGSEPVNLVVVEEPPVRTPAPVGPQSPIVAPPHPDGAAVRVAGATSFDRAPRVRPGVVQSTILPGETRLFRVALAHGQSLRAGVSVEQSLTGDPTGSGSTEALAVHVLAPTRGRLPHPEHAEVSQPVDGDPAFTLTAPVGVRTPEDWSSEGGADTGLAGEYYVAVSLAGTEGAALPYTLVLVVEGDRVSGPVYAEGVIWSVADDLAAQPEQVAAGAGPRGQERASRTSGTSSGPNGTPETTTVDAEDTAVSPQVWAVLGLAGALCVTLLALVVLRVWRRRPRPGAPGGSLTDRPAASPPTLVTRPPVPPVPPGPPAPWPGEEH